jgi:Ran GTPase-activating protein (RanGAP) involved in mRNA processing and transport
LSECDLCCESAEYLAIGLGASTSLTSLNLGTNKISSMGSTALAGVLHRCRRLRTLSLNNNRISGKSAAAALANGLETSTALRRLNLSNNTLGDDGVGVLATKLKVAALTHLDLSYCNVGEPGAKNIGPLLAKCRSLRQLYFSANRIGPKGAVYLARGLQACTALECLYLNYCEIGDAGAESVAQALAGCQSLRKLSLCYCNLGAEGGASLKRAFRGSTALQTLRMSEKAKPQIFFDRLPVEP